MFNQRKKIEAFAAEEAAKMQRTAEEFKTQIETVGRISDAGEKYLALEEIGQQIQKCRSEVKWKRPDGMSLTSEVFTQAGGFLSMMGGGVLLAAELSSGAPFFTGASIFFGGGASFFSGLKSEKNDDIYRQAINVSVDSTFDDLSRKLKGQKKSILLNELPGIAASPRFDELYENASDVKEAFAKAAERKAARESVAPAAPQRVLKPRPLE